MGGINVANKYLMGIDFGTCFSFSVAIINERFESLMARKHNRYTGIPSTFLHSNKNKPNRSEKAQYVCGHEAEKLIETVDNCIFFNK